MVEMKRYLPPMAEQTLRAVGRYHQLTTEHLLSLGISRNAVALRRCIRDHLTCGKRPLLARTSYAEDAHSGRRRRHDLLSLTRHGAASLEDLDDLPLSSIAVFRDISRIDHDYVHRIKTIAALIALDQRAATTGLLFEHLPYFAPKNACNGRQRAFTTPDGDKVIPDSLSMLKDQHGNVKALYALELHHTHKPRRISEQLWRLMHLSASGRVALAYGVQLPLRVLSVALKPELMETVRQETLKDKNFREVFAPYVWFGTLEDIPSLPLV